MQLFAAHVGRLPEGDREQVTASVDPSVWNDIASASALTWLPFDANLVCTHAVAACLGPERTDEFFRTLLLSTFRTPLLQGLVDAVVRKLGRDPGASLFWVARGFDLMFEDCGAWRVVERAPNRAALQVVGLPFAVANDHLWIQSVASALRALGDIAHLDGTTTIREIDPKAGRVVFLITW